MKVYPEFNGTATVGSGVTSDANESYSPRDSATRVIR